MGHGDSRCAWKRTAGSIAIFRKDRSILPSEVEYGASPSIDWFVGHRRGSFRNWLHTRNSKLWLSGIPGAGKTLLAASVIEETITESSFKREVGYFYCDYKDAEKQNPVNILGSLGAQLARQNEDAFSLL